MRKVSANALDRKTILLAGHFFLYELLEFDEFGNFELLAMFSWAISPDADFWRATADPALWSDWVIAWRRFIRKTGRPFNSRLDADVALECFREFMAGWDEDLQKVASWMLEDSNRKNVARLWQESVTRAINEVRSWRSGCFGIWSYW